jgi:hypothetical protein
MEIGEQNLQLGATEGGVEQVAEKTAEVDGRQEEVVAPEQLQNTAEDEQIKTASELAQTRENIAQIQKENAEKPATSRQRQTTEEMLAELSKNQVQGFGAKEKLRKVVNYTSGVGALTVISLGGAMTTTILGAGGEAGLLGGLALGSVAALKIMTGRKIENTVSTLDVKGEIHQSSFDAREIAKLIPRGKEGRGIRTATVLSEVVNCLQNLPAQDKNERDQVYTMTTHDTIIRVLNDLQTEGLVENLAIKKVGKTRLVMERLGTKDYESWRDFLPGNFAENFPQKDKYEVSFNLNSQKLTTENLDEAKTLTLTWLKREVRSGRLAVKSGEDGEIEQVTVAAPTS